MGRISPLIFFFYEGVEMRIWLATFMRVDVIQK